MKRALCIKSDSGFSLLELLVSILILIPIMGAAVNLFSVGARQHATEQDSIDINQDARTAFEMMTTEIAQAGSHNDSTTTVSASLTGDPTIVQQMSVASTAGITASDWVEIDTGGAWEAVKLTAVSPTTISGVFRWNHLTGAKVHMFALPYKNGIVPPPGMAANSSSNVSTLKFFGHINGNSILQYVEYAYDAAKNQITRSITDITQGNKGQAAPFVSNVKSAQFTLNSDNLGIITSVNISMTVQGSVKTGTKYQESELSSRIAIPSTAAASKLSYEVMRYGGVDKLPQTPSIIGEWSDATQQ